MVSLSPFPCPNCGHELLIDKIRLQPEPQEVVVLDWSSSKEPSYAPTWIRAMGRWELEWHVVKQKNTIKRLEQSWWERLLRWVQRDGS
jgi:hypothetical protein